MKPTRNYGIDLLRIVSMFMVVVLHMVGQGGIIDSTTPPPGRKLLGGLGAKDYDLLRGELLRFGERIRNVEVIEFQNI